MDVDVNNGTSSAYNAVLKKIDTPWVAVIHADDMWYPAKLEKQMAFLEQHPDYCILDTWYDYVDIHDKVIGTSKEPLTTWEKVAERYNNDKMVVFCHPSVVFSHDVALAVGGFHEEFWPTDDADMWQRMLETGGKACIYPEALVKISPFVWPIVYNDSMRIDERQKMLDISTFWKERWFGLKKMLKCSI